MNNFRFYSPTEIYFGYGILRSALEDVKEVFQNKNVFIVAKNHSEHLLEPLEIIFKIIKPIASRIVIFSEFTMNPKLDEVRKGIKAGKKNRAQIVIGLGGGSAIDTAKAVAVGIATDKDISEYLYGRIPSDKTLPIIAIPTTPGTGSETSKGGIITDVDAGIKTGIRGDAIFPKIAIVDSKLAASIPPHLYAMFGFDILAHATESYFSRKANLFSKTLSERAVYILGECLPKILNGDKSSENYDRISFAGCIMGINLANVGTLLPHRMQYPIGALTDTAHAAGVATLYPVWLSYCDNQKKGVLEKLLGTTYEKYIATIEMSENLSSLKVTKEQIPEMIEKLTGDFSADCVADNRENIREIYEKSL